ncbi:tobamovirus multiplication protein 1-like isoform X1 [Musa acuminata AAA Group]|uniref:tobamovirus multiplication protein 1-like isoform X1 n=1 Tax=Musa acuminata AAA Group TaxID=214697 RepID=UPI0031D26C72
MRTEGGAGHRCLPTEVVAADAALAVVDGALAVVAFLQLLRIHLRNQQLGWTRQKIFHLMIGSSNIGYLVYFIFTIVATCEGWQCWSHGCGFILMACPQILFLAAFLLLVSFWIDLCHQANDDEEDDDEHGYNEALLEKSKSKQGSPHVDGHMKCCFPRTIHIGSRQKFVILVIVLTFVSVISFAILIWIGRGKTPINSSLVARVSLDIFSVAILLLGGALACYGVLLFSKMSKVRSEMASNEMWKVASLAAVSVTCFTSSAVLALVTNIPLEVLFYWHAAQSDHISSSVLIFLYYFIGSSVPSGFVLWVMREMPPRLVADSHRPARPTVVNFISERTTQNPQWRATVTSSQNKGLKSSPI